MSRFISVLSVGLFTGFTFFYAFILAPASELLGSKSYGEFFISIVTHVRSGVRATQVLMFIAVVAWLWKLRHSWKSINFVCVILGLLLICQGFVLAVLGHYRVNDEFRYYLSTETLPPHWKDLRLEWGRFMLLHLATNVVAFMILLIPLLRTWRGYEADQHHTPSYKPDDTTSAEVELHLKLHSRSNEPSASPDKTH
ncbi:hypothetical protein D3C87_109080 [compost metagenome]